MSSNDIIDALDMLNDDIIEETDALRSVKLKKKPALYKRIMAVAACLALIITAVSAILLYDKGSSPELPKLTVMQNINGGVGFEGLMAYDISQIANNNPWKEEIAFLSLPVYRNTFDYDENSDNPWAVSGHTEKLKGLIIDIAKIFKIDADELIFSDDATNEQEKKVYAEKFAASGEKVPSELFEPTQIIAENDEIKISAIASLTVSVSFKNPITLPKPCSLSDYSNCVNTAEYLKNEYKDIIAMKNPVIDVYGGDCSVDGERSAYGIRFYESDENNQTEFINYSFFSVEFFFDDNENLVSISFHNTDLSQKLGDYPIITVSKAKELLKSGDYISDVPDEYPGEKYIAKTELIYQTDPRLEVFMPYYKFYVEMPKMKTEGGLKTYGIYYVPAVEGEYIQK